MRPPQLAIHEAPPPLPARSAATHGARSQADCGLEADKNRAASPTKGEKRRTRPLRRRGAASAFIRAGAGAEDPGARGVTEPAGLAAEIA